MQKTTPINQQQVEILSCYCRGTQQDYSEATNHLLKCLDYFELRFGTLHPIIAEISHSLGKLLSDDDNQVTRSVN